MEISLEKLLTPENDMQELWELNGRVKAVLAWAASDAYIEKNVLAAMLGASPQTGASAQIGAFAQTEKTEGTDDEQDKGRNQENQH